MKVGVIDYGVGNLGSMMRALEELSVSATLVDRPTELRENDRLILPGVGNFADCARLLKSGEWDKGLKEEVLGRDCPLLGVCVGMQLLADGSSEGSDDVATAVPGLGFISGRVEHLSTLGCRLRVPHVGWNDVSAHGAERNSLLNGIPDRTDFYFVHSYAFLPADPKVVVATTNYGIPVTAAVRHGGVWGTQFHPEKSSRAGLRLLRNFIEGAGC